jgi:hypothetical protein
VVLVIGGNWDVEHEGMDRTTIELPLSQQAVVDAITAAVGSDSSGSNGVGGHPHSNPSAKPVVAVLVHGGSMDIGSVLDKCDAVVDAFYPGMYGAGAIAETIFGDHNPGGKSPYTFYRAGWVHRSDFNEFSMAKPPGRGYRYMDPEDVDLLLPFGWGLSYTNFSIKWASGVTPPASVHAGGSDGHGANTKVPFAVTVTNTGTRKGTETVMLFLKHASNTTNPGGPGKQSNFNFLSPFCPWLFCSCFLLFVF